MQLKNNNAIKKGHKEDSTHREAALLAIKGTKMEKHTNQYVFLILKFIDPEVGHIFVQRKIPIAPRP